MNDTPLRDDAVSMLSGSPSLQDPTVTIPSRSRIVKVRTPVGIGGTYRRPGPQLCRNAPCLCGSGKKFKSCCKRRP